MITGRWLLIAALMVPCAAPAKAPDDDSRAATVDTQPADSPEESEESVDTQAETGEGETGDTQATGGTDAERSGAQSEDVFVPTEKVSEDLSVTFPVDI